MKTEVIFLKGKPKGSAGQASIFDFARPYLRYFIIGPMFKVIEAIFELIVPLVMADIINQGIYASDRGFILRRGGVLLLLAAVGLSCTLVCQIVASKTSQGMGTDLRRALMKKVTELSHAELDLFGTPSLTQRITTDVNQIQLAVAMVIRLLIRAPFLAVGAAVMACTIDAGLSLVLFALIPLLALVLWFVMSRTIPIHRTNQKRLDGISRLVRENLSGARVIRAFSRQKSEEKRFDNAADEYAVTAARAGILSALLNPITTLIMNTGVLLLIALGALRVDSGHLTQGELVAFVNYISQISIAVVVVASVVGIFTRASASLTRVFELLNTEISVTEAAGALPVQSASDAPAVELRNVSFGYTPERNVLTDISFTLPRGATVGIIGGTGSGKSTLAALIMRFYDPAGGQIFVNGCDIKQVTLSSLRHTIAIVPQRPALVSGTIASNLRWAKSDASEDKLREALSIAQADDFVERRGGLESSVEQNGGNLSGGQKQRLSVARALLSRPEILILDDSSSALDAGTDYRMREAIRRELPDTTLLMITQRAGSILNADMIIVLDGGRIAGIGSHSELLCSCTVYREICRSQNISVPGGEEK
ncbi:MAG: ABC transporter ATP-binding protein [Clostridiales bacterium]|nr:ABC transporter ATP-binding protein [Clostridiales bacterium]